jgi:hypothetical protein
MAKRPFASLDFDLGVAPAMVMTVFSRQAAERLPAGPFHPPFPDFYTLTGLLLTAESWAYESEMLVVGGVSRRSAMDSINRGLPRAAVARMGMDRPDYAWLEGNPLLNATVDWLLRVKQDFPRELTGVELNRRLYVARQVWAWVREWKAGDLAVGELWRRFRALSRRDLKALVAAAVRRSTWSAGRASARAHLRGESMIDGRYQRLTGIRDAGEFARWAQAR